MSILSAGGSIANVGAGAGGGLSGMLSSFQQQFANAVAANRQRYEQILGAYQNRERELSAHLEGLGQGALRDARDRYTQDMAQQRQNLVTRGLSNTTISASVLGAASERYNRDVERINEGIRRERLAVGGQLSGDTLRYAGSYQDPYPSYSEMAGLATAGANLDLQNRRLALEQQGRMNVQFGGGGGGSGGGGGGGRGGGGGSFWDNFMNRSIVPNNSYATGAGGGGGTGGYSAALMADPNFRRGLEQHEAESNANYWAALNEPGWEGSWGGPDGLEERDYGFQDGGGGFGGDW